MKKFIVSLLLFVPLLTGCTNIDTQLTINDDKSASIVSSLTYTGDLADKTDVNALTIANSYKNFLDKNYTVENAYGAKLSTITGTKSVKNIEHTDLDLSSLGVKSNLPSGKFIEVKKNLLVTSFNIDAVYNMQEQLSKITEAEISNDTINKVKTLVPEYYQKYAEQTETEAEQREDFMQNLDDETKKFIEESHTEAVEQQTAKNEDYNASFSIKVPSFASYNNADSAEGSLYTWNINKEGETVIKLQYVKYNSSAILILILAGIALLILLARKILKHDSQKRVGN